MIRTEIIPVYGMMCGHCVKAVTMALEDIDGVTETDVSLEGNCTTVTFDDGTADLERIKSAIVEEGYTLEPEVAEEALAPDAAAEEKQGLPETVTSQLTLEGMSCVNCAAAIEKAFSRTAGIRSVSINFSLEKGFVEFDERELDAAAVLQVVRDAGYAAVEEGQAEKASPVARKEKYRFWFALVCTVPLVVLMYTMPFGHVGTNYVMFVLATLVQFVSGRTFYEGAWHSLKNRSTNMDVLIALGISAAYF